MKEIRTLIIEASEYLRERGVAEPAREARLLMAYTLKRDQSFLRGHPEYMLKAGEHALFTKSVNRRGSGEPFQHISGRQEFYGLEFIVSPDVLVPRPETELLVETALREFSSGPDPYICDLGTGSGCIGVSLLLHFPNAVCIATDISESAISIARLNAKKHGVEERFLAVLSDVFKALPAEPLFDLIVANPPYVPKKDLANLQIEVRSFDPEVALTDGGDGLSVLRRIENAAYSRLRNPGMLIMEFGFGQSEAVAGVFKPGPWESSAVKTDLQGIPRVISAKKSE